MKKILIERFQQLAGIKSLVEKEDIKQLLELEMGDNEFEIAGEDGIETRDINKTINKLMDTRGESREVAGFVQLNVLDLMVRGVDKIGKTEIYEAWAEFSKALDDNNVAGI